ESGKWRKKSRWTALQLGTGIDPWHWHTLRHTCATSLGAGWWGERWSLDEIAQMLGQLSTDITRRYRHLIDDALNGIASRTVGLPASVGNVQLSMGCPRDEKDLVSSLIIADPERKPCPILYSI